MNVPKIKMSREIYAKLMEEKVKLFKNGIDKTIDEINEELVNEALQQRTIEVMKQLHEIVIQPGTIQVPPPIENKDEKQAIQTNENEQQEVTYKGQHEFFTIEQASSYLGVSQGKIEEARRKGDLNGYKLDKGFSYKRKELDKWMEKYIETRKMTGKNRKLEAQQDNQ